MKSANITQQQLAERLGVSQPTVSTMLNPKSDPRLSTLRKLARALGITLDVVANAYEDKEPFTPDDPWANP
jgi:transcriptional regulator with XRE-family HTH domain